MYTEVFGSTLIELGREDSRLIAVTPAMPGGSGLFPFAKEFPDRMIDVGIAEQHAATLCAALAMEGMKPVYAVYSTFMQRAYDQIVHDICRHNANVMFAIDRAGFVGADGETHQGVYDVAFMRHIPNMVMMMPKDENELRHMMKTALEYNDGPIAYRYPRINGTGVAMDAELHTLPIGSWERLRTGEGYAVVACGPMVQVAEEAADLLKREGIQVGVVNARFLKPLDNSMLLDLAHAGTNMVVIEEACQAGSLGSAVLEFYAEHEIYDARVHLMGVPDIFVEHGSIKEQRQQTGLTVEALCGRIKSMMALSAYNYKTTSSS
ncbi:1-deoxy-D-xylulose-5-phosphate synthase [compost metagenome]